MKRNVTMIIALLFTTVMLSQKSLNEYRYVIVPKTYSFLKSADKYQLNTLTRYLFKKEGFVVHYDDEPFTSEYMNNPCLGLKADVESSSGMFSTKLNIKLSNCANETVFVSDEGKSREKDFKKAYHEALRNAFKSVSALNYQYQPKEEKIVESPKQQEVTVPVGAKEVNAVERSMPKVQETKKVNSDALGEMVLYAQPIENGYQLVDTTPQVIMKILKTSIPDVFLIENGLFNGMVQKQDGEWYLEAKEQGKVIKQKLNIKF